MTNEQSIETNAVSAPVQLDAAALEMVTGGINPQPLPPRREPDLLHA
jgi:hypothetical protein